MADLAVQHVQCDIATDGDTFAITDVSDLSKAFLFNASSRLRSGGRLNSVSNIPHEDLSTALQLTSTTQITGRLCAGESDTHRHRIQVVSYEGAGGGAHEFVVRWRGTVTIPAATGQVTQSLAGAGVANRNGCIPMIGGYTHAAWATNVAAQMGPYAYLDSSGDLVVGRSPGAGSLEIVVYVEVVEFVGSAWSVGHARVTGKGSAQTNHTLYVDSEGASGTVLDVGNWADAMIVSHVGSTNSVRLDSFGAHVYPQSGSTTAVTHEMFSTTPSFGGHESMVHVLLNADLVVARYTGNINPAVGDNDFTITAVPDIGTTLVGWTHTTSGSGNAYGRGDGSTYLKNTTTASMWVHRSGNSGEYSMEIVDLSGLVGASAFVGSAAASQAAQTGSASGSFSVPSFAATGAPSQDAQSSSAAGAFTTPAFAATGAASQDAQSATGSGAFTNPTFSSTGSSSQADQTPVASGAFTNPTLSGSGAPSQADQTASASGAFTAPTFAATGSPTQAAQTAAASGNFDAPVFSASGTPTEAADVAAGAGNYDPAPVSGSAAASQADQTASAVGVFDAPGFGGSGSPSQADQTATAAGAYTPPAITGSGSPSQAAQVASASGVFGSGANVGSGTPSQADQTSSASGVFTPAAISGSAAVVQAAQTATGVAGFTPPTFSGSAVVDEENQTATAEGVFSYSVSGAGAPVQSDQTSTGVGGGGEVVRALSAHLSASLVLSNAIAEPLVSPNLDASRLLSSSSASRRSHRAS